MSPRAGGADDPPSPAWLLTSLSNMFFGYAGFSMVLPTLWPYLRQLGASTRYFAAAVAAYGVGEGFGGWMSGRLYHRYPEHPKTLLLLGMCVGLLGALAYVCAAAVGPAGPAVIVLARFATGYDTGTRQTIEQTLIVQQVPPRHQTACSSRLSSCATTGAMLGPTLGAPLQVVHFKICGLRVDGNNGPGVVLLLVCIMNIAISMQYFNVEGSRDICSRTTTGVGDDKAHAALPSRLGVLVCYMIFFGVNLNLASIETMTPLLAQRLYGWGPCLDPSDCPFKAPVAYVNVLLTSGALLSLARGVLMSFCLGRLTYGRERAVIGVGQAILALANLCNMDIGGSLPKHRFVADFLLCAFFGGLARGPAVTLLSQIIGPHPKAGYMGWLSAVGALPRILGPFAFVELLDMPRPLHRAVFPHVYEGSMPRTWLLYGGQGATYLTILLCLQTVRPDLKRHPSLRHLAEPLMT